MAYEYNVEDILIVLEKEDVLEGLTKEAHLLPCFSYYSKEEKVKIVVEKIKNSSSEKIRKYIKGLISIYPLSNSILTKIMQEFTVPDMVEDFEEWYDIENTMIQTCNKFFTIYAEQKLDDKTFELEQNINDLKDTREKNLLKREKLLELRKENKELIDEVFCLENECKHLEKESSKELLNQEKQKLEKEKHELMKKAEENRRELKKMQEEMKKLHEVNDDAKFRKALTAFENVVKMFPKDEEDD